jgi:hypothetical protein
MGACNHAELRRLFNDASVSVGWTLRVRVAVSQELGAKLNVNASAAVTPLAVSRHTQTPKFPNRGRITSPSGS